MNTITVASTGVSMERLTKLLFQTRYPVSVRLRNET